VCDSFDPSDFEQLEAAGIAKPRERADLIKYLDGLGFTVDEMVEACTSTTTLPESACGGAGRHQTESTRLVRRGMVVEAV
jgi:hypothetical protein